MTDRSTISLVGSTGSIGTQTLDVVRGSPDSFAVQAIGAARSVEILAAQAAEFHPAIVAIADEALAPALKAMLPHETDFRAGAEALASIATESDVCVNGVVGFAGLPVTLATLGSGRRLALANKESLIAGGPVVATVRETPGAEIVPVDSEHCALHQCLRAGRPEEVRRLVLTASGGPFRGRSREELARVTVDEALTHPTWSMGPKITIDSSTLMNKGLEVIEANELFGASLLSARGPGSDVFDMIDVVVHAQSIVHSIVEFTDGAAIAQLSQPDMRLPIGYALGHPARLPVPYGAIDWTQLGTLTFEPPDREAFPCLELAYEAGRMGGLAPAWLNAANEVAVAAFLEGRIRWISIASVIADTLEARDQGGSTADTLEAVIDADRTARQQAALSVAAREA